MKAKEKAIREEAEDILLDLGITPNIMGFGYIRDGVEMAVMDQGVLSKMTTKLYPAIAEKNDSKPQRVERAIRHAIELVYNRSDLADIDRTFRGLGSPEKGKATNGEFLAAMTLKVQRKLGL